MHIEVSQSLLLQALRRIAAAVPSKTVIPILSGIQVEADANGITLTASQISMILQATIPTNGQTTIVHQRGSIVIPARYLIDIVRHLPDGMIRLTVDNDFKVCIQSGQAIYHLCGMDHEEYPQLAHFDYDHAIRLPNEHLKRMMKQVAFAVSTSEVRPVLTGISCKLSDNHIRLTATDGIRLASRETNIEHSAAKIPPVIIPGKHLSDYCKILDGEAGTTDIHINKQTLLLRTNNLIMQTARLEGSYPSLDAVAPKSYLTELAFDANNLLRALERVSLLADDHHIIRLHMTSNQSIELSSRAAAIGHVVEEVPYEAYSGERVTIYFNSTYLKDILRHIDCSSVTLRFSGASSPIVVQPTDHASALYILAPSRSHA